ncbi:6-phosphofructo-2-kinase/fructose-2 6-biphosphatase-1-like protein [Leptomonas seymouri]|uniref:6-phosphofructo-2-kinase/fructose-2 6-biphosphatase-1-like protein n=1 Tax=Leptomonas seymouri TaxID=5684 RepID=A0A0N1HXF4_LEPSE|nr:6-phosphofructo-2-kinase/fructose-2 6-biphosphatase-1-like protein [Leptomonas seymouri]|eukprot:KPI85903.1 6-phosphofructo-2-kinase/fructose-2 6-biphosphatase-1-like protein [Leptomonas seymouri]
MSESPPLLPAAHTSPGLSPQAHLPAADTSIKRKQKPISFQRMAAIQEEIARIDKHLEALQESESKVMGPETVAQSNLTTEDVIDPVVLHMLTVELCQLAASGDAVGARILLSGGADPNSRDYDGSTLLHIACMNGHLSVMNVLLEFGADASLVDRDGFTPLEVAEENGFADIVQSLSGYFHKDTTVVLNTLDSRMSSPASSPASMHHPDFSTVPQPMIGSLIVIMVGLPGRGKTMVAQQIRRYFQWNGLMCSIFSHQAYRRRAEKAMVERSEGGGGGGIDTNSPAAAAELESRVSKELAQDLTKYVWNTSGVAILDGTQTTHARRQSLLRAIRDTRRINMTRVVFVEVLMNNPEAIMANILRAKETFVEPPADFVERYYALMAQHELVYKTLNPITDCDTSYIRIEDAQTYSLNMISGWMPSRLAFMLHNLSYTPVNLYLTRSGEYVDMLNERIGGNSRLTKRGWAYSRALLDYFKSEISPTTSLTVMTSCAKRCTQTVHYFAEESIKLQEPPNATGNVSERKQQQQQQQQKGLATLRCRVSYFPTLDDINHGDCEGQLLSDVLRTMPNTLQSMKADPYYTAWPNGECIHQVFNSRLEPHIHDIQASTTPVLVCSHLNLLQGLYSYFVTEGDSVITPQNALKIDIHTEYVIKIRMVGVNRVAEWICLSDAVEAILKAEDATS